MGFEVELKMKTTDEIVKVRGLGEKGDVQKFVDAECIRHMDKYTPMLSGVMIDSAITGTVIGSGLIEYNSPYARYQYYGEVYGPNFPIFEDGQLAGFRSPKGQKKNPTGRSLKYNTAMHPLAGKMWFERMKADSKEDILSGARKIAGAK